MPDQLLVITGGAGRIGTALRPLLRPQYRLRVVDVREPPAELDGDEYLPGDVSRFADAEQAMAGAHAVLHLAGNASTSATWDQVRTTNIEATNNVFEAARRQGVRRVVFASTNHVMGFYNLEKAWPIDTRSPIRPDSLYGVSKAFGEALARYYADAFDMSMICLRIGWFTPSIPDSAVLNPLWISARDLAQIVQRCLETPRRFGIYNATSNNPQRQWDLQSSRDELGYEPQDVVRNASRQDGPPYVVPQAGVIASMPTVEAICIARAASAAMESLPAVEAIAGEGLVGDRYLEQVGFYSPRPTDPGAREVTLFEAESLDWLRTEHGITLSSSEHRRNLTTRGVRLDDLLGRQFRVGEVLLEGVKDCPPCEHLEALVRKPVLKPLVNRGGLRARVIEGGTIRVGDAVVVTDSAVVQTLGVKVPAESR
jgi:nucleoside-diphosphate-sugar epimerase